MFKKLRTKFILTSTITTTIVLIIAFSAIYITASASSDRRPPFNQNHPNFSKDISAVIDQQIHEERQASLQTLMVTLIITGAFIELMVILISFYLAEQAIKPVRETYLAQKEFIANASHEIKTPLAVIQANLEAADIKNNHWIDNVATKTAELSSLSNQLLALARVEANVAPAKKQTLNLMDFINGLISPLEPQLKHQKKRITTDSSSLKKPEITADQASLSQLLNILLDNAIKYSAKNITIILSDNAVAIKNDGATIKKDQLAHIFDRFYQTDKTKNGVGLGLAIAKKIADANSWKLTVSSDKSSTIFKVML